MVLSQGHRRDFGHLNPSDSFWVTGDGVTDSFIRRGESEARAD